MLARLAVALAIVLAPLANARAVVVLAIPRNEFLEYFGTPITVTAKGGPLYLVNTDGVPHSVVSDVLRLDGSASWCEQFDPGQCPLFWSPPVVDGVTEVRGIDATAHGTRYEFSCGVHPTMHGSLIVA